MAASPPSQYLAGYAIEESLSIDNLFVFLLLFRFFQIDQTNSTAFSSGESPAPSSCAELFIAAGISLLARFSWISYVFAAILLFASIRLVLPVVPQ